MRTPFIVTHLCLCLLFCAVSNAQSLDRKFIHVEVKKKKKRFIVNVENLMPFDVTVTLDLTLNNLISSKPLPYVGTLRGKEKRPALELRLKDRGKSGSYQSEYFYTIGNMQARHDSSYVYQLPYEVGAKYPVVQGYKGAMTHDQGSEYAVDFGMPEGTHVCAARKGVVVGLFEGSDQGGPNEAFNKMSNYVFIRHGDLTIGAYHHLQKDGVLVRIGQTVERGQNIAYSGKTGFTFGPHLHFEVLGAVDGKRTQSFPVKFQTQEGIIDQPVADKSYRAN